MSHLHVHILTMYVVVAACCNTIQAQWILTFLPLPSPFKAQLLQSGFPHASVSRVQVYSLNVTVFIHRMAAPARQTGAGQ